MTSEVTRDKLARIRAWNHSWEPLRQVVEEGIEVDQVATDFQSKQTERVFTWSDCINVFPKNYKELHDWMSNSSFQKAYGAAQYPDKPLTQFGYDVLIGLYDMHCIPTDKGVDTDF